jgi:hypothetical protein
MLAKGLIVAAVVGAPLLGLAVVLQGEVAGVVHAAAEYVTLGLLLVVAYNAGRVNQKVTSLGRRMDRIEKHLFGG